MGGVERISSSDTVDVLLTAAADSVGGFVRGPDSGYDLVLGGIDSVVSAQFAGLSTTVTRLSPATWQLSLTGAGSLLLTTVATDTMASPSDTTVADPGDSTVVNSGDTVVVAPTDTPADFSGDGVVDFSDFFQFADVFGLQVEGQDARFDLDGDGMVDFSDFFIFADAFGG